MQTKYQWIISNSPRKYISNNYIPFFIYMKKCTKNILYFYTKFGRALSFQLINKNVKTIYTEGIITERKKYNILKHYCTAQDKTVKSR